MKNKKTFFSFYKNQNQNLFALKKFNVNFHLLYLQLFCFRTLSFKNFKIHYFDHFLNFSLEMLNFSKLLNLK